MGASAAGNERDRQIVDDMHQKTEKPFLESTFIPHHKKIAPARFLSYCLVTFYLRMFQIHRIHKPVCSRYGLNIHKNVNLYVMTFR